MATRERASIERKHERLIGCFMLGILLFNPLMIRAFDRGADVVVLGVPLLYVYLFAGWAVLILLSALSIEGPADDGDFAPGQQPSSQDGRHV
jgi:hypothetical protein